MNCANSVRLVTSNAMCQPKCDFDLIHSTSSTLRVFIIVIFLAFHSSAPFFSCQRTEHSKNKLNRKSNVTRYDIRIDDRSCSFRFDCVCVCVLSARKIRIKLRVGILFELSEHVCIITLVCCFFVAPYVMSYVLAQTFRSLSMSMKLISSVYSLWRALFHFYFPFLLNRSV